MKAAAFALAGLMAIGLAADGARDRRPAANGPLLLLYVGAEDCGPCRTWRRDHRPALLDDIVPDKVHYREVIAPRLSQAFAEQIWPADLRRYRASAGQAQGVPLWLVIRDEHVLTVAGGLSLWRTRVLPLVRRETRGR
jgi:hypothetical protein